MQVELAGVGRGGGGGVRDLTCCCSGGRIIRHPLNESSIWKLMTQKFHSEYRSIRIQRLGDNPGCAEIRVNIT